MKLLHLKRRYYEARLAAYEAALRAMKRSLFRFHVFLPLEKRQKNGGRTRNRTGDTGIFSPLLYLLSYPATLVVSASLASRLARCFITLVLFFKIANFFLFFFDFSLFFYFLGM